MVTATLIAAVCIQQRVDARDGGAGHLRPMIDAFTPEDQPLLKACCARVKGKTARQKNGYSSGSPASTQAR
jgi:hypothetical protein